ncbi:MAG: hypothetical protein ACHQNT_10955 [Bacteroidia bacterium]
MNDNLPKKGSILNPCNEDKMLKNISILINERFEIYFDGVHFKTCSSLLNAQQKVQLYAQEKFDSYKVVYFSPPVHISGKLGLQDTVVGRMRKK